MSKSSRRWLAAWGVAALALVVAAVATGLAGGSAKVEGRTPQERIACIGRLADQQPRGAAEGIAAAVRDADPAVRQAALLCLTRFVQPRFRPAVEAATRDENASVRAAAAGTLGLYGDEAAADRLNELVRHDAPEVRLAALAGLGRGAVPKAVVHLVEAAEKHDDQAVRFRAMEVLLRRYGLEFAPARVRTPADWLDALESAKGIPQVEAAYRSVGRTLVRHPEHIRHK